MDEALAFYNKLVQKQQERQQNILTKFAELNSELKKAQKELENREEELRSKEKKFNDLKESMAEQQKRIDETIAKVKITSIIGEKNQKIKLRIGETLFITSLDTLSSEKDTCFSALFSEYFKPQPDEDGEVFIDRDPTHFKIILNHLRGMDVTDNIATLNDIQKKELR